MYVPGGPLAGGGGGAGACAAGLAADTATNGAPRTTQIGASLRSRLEVRLDSDLACSIVPWKWAERRRGQHGTSDALCADCAALLSYAGQRLERCPFQENKPTCANCTVHCYNAQMRARIREVMRYAGPRMLLRHPVLAVHHLLDGRRPAPQLKKRAGSE